MSKKVDMKSSDPLGVVGILRESIKIFPRNWKVMASIVLLTLVSFNLLFLGNLFSIQPLIFDSVMNMLHLSNEEPGSPVYLKTVSEIKKEVAIFVVIELIFIAASWIVSLFSMISTIYTSAMSYSNKSMTLKELLVRIGRTWRSPAVTWFYVSLFSVACSFIALAIVGLFTKAAYGSIPLGILALLVAILVLGISLYLSLVWMVGLLVSVLEDGYCGMKALGKAEELIKRRKLQGCVLTLVLALVPITIFIFYGTTYTKIGPIALFFLMLGLTNVMWLWKIFSCMVYTVFYCECKKSNGEEVELQFGLGYYMLPTIANVNAALP